MHRFRLLCLSATLLFLYITNIQAQDPYFEPTPTICEGFMQSQLTVGDYGRVTPGSPNNVRAEPNTSAEKIGEIPGDRRFTVLEGPVCAEGMAWWKVDYRGLVGWTVEGIGSEYFLRRGPETCESMFEVGDEVELVEYGGESLFAGPSKATEVLATIDMYSSVTIMGEPECDEYVAAVYTPAQYKGVSGWIKELNYSYCEQYCTGVYAYIVEYFRAPLSALTPTNRVIAPATIPIPVADNAISSMNIDQLQNTKLIGDGFMAEQGSSAINSPDWSGDEEFLGLFNGSDYQIYKVRQMNIPPFVFKDRMGTFRPNSPQVAIAADRQIDIYNVNDLTTVENTLKDFSGNIFRAEYSPDGRVLVTFDDGDGVKIWDAETLLLIDTAPLPGTEYRFFTLTFDESGNYLVVTGHSDYFYQWDLRDLSSPVLQTHAFRVSQRELEVYFSKDGQLYVVYDGTFSPQPAATVYHIDKATEVNLEMWDDTYYAWTISDDGRYISAMFSDLVGDIAPSSSTTRFMWESETGVIYSALRVVDYMQPHPGFIDMSFFGQVRVDVVGSIIQAETRIDMGFSPSIATFDDPYIAVGRDDGGIFIYHSSLGLIGTYYGLNARVRSIEFSPSLRYITAIGDDNSMRVWEVESQTRLGSVVFEQFGQNFIINPEGTLTVTHTDLWDVNYTELWDLETGEHVKDLDLPLRVSSQIITDGQLIHARENKNLISLDLSTGETKDLLLNTDLGYMGYHPYNVTRDGRYIVVNAGGEPNIVRTYDLTDGSMIIELENYFESGETAINPYGNSFAVFDDGAEYSDSDTPERRGLSIWDLTSGELLRYFPTAIRAREFNFNFDGTKILSVGTKGEYLREEGEFLIVYDLITGEEKIIRELEFYVSEIEIWMSRDSSLIILPDQLGNIYFIDVATGEILRQIATSSATTESPRRAGIALSEDGSKLFTTGGDGVLRVWEIVP